MTRTALATTLVVWALTGAVPSAPEKVSPNDNRRTAGILKDGVLTLDLEIRSGEWYPEGDKGLSVRVAAFAEVGKPLQTPGPMIRVPQGTMVRVSIKNTFDKRLMVFGFGPKHKRDTTIVAAGETVTRVFNASDAGTWYYQARSGLHPVGIRFPEESQLHGALIVDPPGTDVSARPERIMVMSWYLEPNEKSVTGVDRGTMAINGLAWPNNERLTYAQGDSVHWRVLNLTEGGHPMHLHGFYFRVDEHGNNVYDSTYTTDQKRMAVTELIPGQEYVRLSWKADRPGNWLYHCHLATHLSVMSSLDTALYRQGAMEHHAGDDHPMYGLVTGITIAPRGPQPVASKVAPRKIRVVQRKKPNVYGTEPGMTWLVDGWAESTPAPPLVLERDRPVAVTIVNESDESATIHWHGIELDSYADGVPNWSGAGATILKAIKPRDSLTVRWTPPRAGTFMYHAHFNEVEQQGRGLYGPIVVLNPGEKFDAATDKILFFSTAGPTRNGVYGPFADWLLNGEQQPQAIQLNAGATYRFRLINLAGDLPLQVSLMSNQAPLTWHAIAKDGFPLPGVQAVDKPAVLIFEAGEIYDYEFTPSAAGILTLTYGAPSFILRGGGPNSPFRFPQNVSVPVVVR